MTRRLNCALLLAALFLLQPAPARAAESFDNCAGFVRSLPATITTQGVWCMDRDLATNLASGNAITIATNNVTIDCNAFKIGNLAAGPGTEADGVRATARLNASVRNCNIRGFRYGVAFIDGSGHLVEDSRFDNNTQGGILLTAAGSTIRNNLIIDTGGATSAATAVLVLNGVDILGNTIDGVVSTGNSSIARGIYAVGSGSITGNRVSGLAANSNQLGIETAGRGVIRDNDVYGPGPDVIGGIGILCANNLGMARDNAITGFETGVRNCFSSLNAVNPN